MSHPLAGILPATVTPLDDAGRFARAPFERLLARLYEKGVHGVYVCGTTGEGLLLPRADREAVTEAAVACTPAGRHVIAHVGAASMAETLALTEHAARVGAHAISSMPPTVAPFSFADVFRYYETLATRSAVPVVVYYLPDVSRAVTTTEQLEAICALPNVCGVKYTDFDLYRMQAVLGPGRVVYNGRDEVLAAGLLMGASGGIGSFYNIAPELFVAIHSAAREGRWEAARGLQVQANTLISLVLRYPLFPAIKQILAWTGIDCGACLPPRPVLDATTQRVLQEELAAAGFDGLVPHAR